MLGGGALGLTRDLPTAALVMGANKALSSTPAKTIGAQIGRGVSNAGTAMKNIPINNFLAAIGSRLAVGSILNTPKGKVEIVGKDKDGHPLIRPLE